MTAAFDHRLPEELAEFQKVVRRFAVEEIAPVIGDYYERGAFPYELVAKMGAMGLFGLPFPEEYRGMGADPLALPIVLEELARVDSSVAVTLEAAISLGATLIFRFGTEEQRHRYLPPLAAGEELAAFAFDRARGRFGRGCHPNHGAARAGPLRAQRHEGVHHQFGHRHHLASHRRGGDGHPGRRAL